MATQKAPSAVKAEETKVKPNPRKVFKKVVVQWLNMDEKNQNTEIVVNDMGVVNGRKAFFPGQEVELSLVQIGILKDAVERVHINIPSASAIYDSENPMAAAKLAFPSLMVKRNKQTGLLYAMKNKPNYSITAAIEGI